MIIYPAIDIKNGQCVRLYQGQFDQQTVYDTTPLTMAIHYESLGATKLHVVDLDGAQKGQTAQSHYLFDIVTKTRLQIQTGGGLRDETTIQTYLDAGINRVVLGSIAVTQSDKVKLFFKQFGAERIVLAIDVQMNDQGVPMAAVHGWQQQSELSLWDVIDCYLAVGLKHILCTDISKDGTLQGPNLALYQTCQKRYPQLQIQASGGVASLADIQSLKALRLAGVIIGKALYEKRFSLREALAC